MDKIFVSKEETSNKMWGYTRNDVDKTVTVQWARLGLEGQKKVHSFGGLYEMNEFISKKEHEKVRGGYNEITPEQYEVEVTMAKTVGVDQKVDQLMFVEEKEGGLNPLDVTKLHNPDIKPVVYARIVGIKRDGVHPVTEFVFTPAESFVVETHAGSSYISVGRRVLTNKFKINPEDSSAKMAAAVEEVVGKVLF